MGRFEGSNGNATASRSKLTTALRFNVDFAFVLWEGITVWRRAGTVRANLHVSFDSKYSLGLVQGKICKYRRHWSYTGNAVLPVHSIESSLRQNNAVKRVGFVQLPQSSVQVASL